MSTSGDGSVIHRKARSGRAEFDTREMTWAKALRLSLERCSDRLMNLPLTVRALEQTKHPLTGLQAKLDDGDRMIMLLEGQGGSPHGRGAVVLGRGLVQTMVEVQTRGHVTRADLDTRPFTNTDAAVAARLIDPVLASVDDMMEEGSQSAGKLSLRFGDRIEDVRTLLLALDAPDYEVFHVTMDVDGDARSADMMLVVPVAMLTAPPPVPEGGEEAEADFDLGSMALSAPVTLDAVLDRVELPLSRIYALKPGDVLAIPANALQTTELLGAKGFVLGKVSLGQINGFRAVRLEPEGEGPPVVAPPVMAADDPAEMLEPVGMVPDPVEMPEAQPLPPLPDPVQSPDMPEVEEPTLESLARDLELPDLPAIADTDALGDLAELPDLPVL